MEGGAESQLTNTQAAANGGAQLQVDFAIKPDQQSQKTKVKNMDELAEERMSKTFNTGGAHEADELKRKREEFAVQLRKSKR